MRILIVTGIYPPEIGGPAEYAKNLESVWKSQGHKVEVKIFGKFKKIPWGIRHVVFLFHIIPAVLGSDLIVTLDSFSAGVVVVAAKLFSKKVIFRTGGDAIWELYVERTGDMVLLKDFYKTRIDRLSLKEKIMFVLMRWALQNLSAIIWSTEWQKQIFMKPYRLEGQKHFIVENYYGPKLQSLPANKKNFIASTRRARWKNLDLLNGVFQREDVKTSGALIDTNVSKHEGFLKRISECYAVIITSLGDISPNTILDSIRFNKPFILTKENGLTDRIRDISLLVDPQNPNDIAQKIIWLSQAENYEAQVEKIKNFNFTHTWEEIAGEYIAVYNSIK